MSVEKQIAVLYCGTNGLLSDVPLDKVSLFEKELIKVLELKHQTDVLDVLRSGVINDDVCDIIKTEASIISKQINKD